jgi:hypothetical protein
VDEPAELFDEAVSVDGEAEELGELADQDGQRQSVHVTEHRRLRQQVGDEAELANSGQHHGGTGEERQH